MKFGGTSVADVAKIRDVAVRVKAEVDAGNEVAVVLSAMSGVTNQLIAYAREAAPMHDAREFDALEKRQAADEAAEAARVAEEKRKREEWKKKKEDDCAGPIHGASD